jgi:hypothetical protein
VTRRGTDGSLTGRRPPWAATHRPWNAVATVRGSRTCVRSIAGPVLGHSVSKGWETE